MAENISDSLEKALNLIKGADGLPVLVVGDVMLDRYVYGDVKRQAPEANAPVLSDLKTTEMPGGAGNVIQNLSKFGMRVTTVGLAGADENADVLDKLLGSTLVRDTSRPTIVKTRYMKGEQLIVRVDDEKTHVPSQTVTQELIKAIDAALPDVKAVILSDYAKGVLSKEILAAVISKARAQNIPVLVDPKGQDFSRYQGASVITPNMKELQFAVDRDLETDEDIVSATRTLLSETGIDAAVVTRSEKGMSAISENLEVHYPAQARTVKNVSGAGDTVIAVLAIALGRGLGLQEATEYANVIVAKAVEQEGTSALTVSEIKSYATEGVAMDPTAGRIAPILSWDKAKDLSDQWKEQGLKVGFTNGCFDILHHGHVTLIEKARQHCDKLIMAINTDASVKRLKGESRPVNDQQARASVLSALASIDMVVFFGENIDENDTPLDVVTYLQPDYLFKGGDYSIDTIVGAEVVIKGGGEVIVIPLEDGFSTTNTIKRITSLNDD